MIKNNHLLIPTLLATAMLSACGGGSSNDATTSPIIPEPTTFQSSFISTLQITEETKDGLKTYNIKNKNTNQNDPLQAYVITTELANTFKTWGVNPVTIQYPQLSQSFSFELEHNIFRLLISYDPILKVVNHYTLIKKDSSSDNVEEEFTCRPYDPNDRCFGTQLSYDNQTGMVEIKFNQSKFKSSSALENTFMLNGTLQGKISISPRTLQDIPKAHQGSIIVEGKTHQIIAAVNTPEKISGAEFFATGIAMLLDDATLISFNTHDNATFSRYIDIQDDNQRADLLDASALIHKKVKTTDQFTLLPSTYDFTNVGSSETRAKIIISGNVEAPLPQQALSISPKSSSSPIKDKDNPWYANTSYFNSTTIPDNFSVRLINHNTVEIEAENIIATIQDKKLKSLKLNDLMFNSNSNSSITQLILLDYQCGDKAPACTGITIEPNGFGVKFNNTTLTNMETHDPNDKNPLPPAIILNGGLVYLGR